MDMETGADVIAVPFPFQGHLNPMLHFCSCLSARGLKVTLLLTHGVAKSMQFPLSHRVELISDGTDVGDPPRTHQEYRTRLQAAVSEGVAAVIQKQKQKAKVLVHDSIMPWLLEVGRTGGLRVASFFTEPAAVCGIYYHMLCGTLKQHTASDSTVRLPSFPAIMDFADLPSFSYFGDIAEEVKEFTINRAINMPKADCFLFNTFDSLEEQVVKWMAENWAVKTIGPLVPTIHKTLKGGKHDRIDLFELDSESYLKWLDIREPKSVVYVSFGSYVVMSEEQMEEIAWGLVQSNKYFIWIVRESELVKLPKDFKFKTFEKGIIVKWCSQVDVLLHRAVACFMTHCGWNSTLEALCLGVPMVGMPYLADQPTNAKLIEDVWKVGIRVKVNEKGIFTRQEIQICIKQVMEGEKANEFRRNVVKWKGLAEEATSEGGSSDVNIKDFIFQMAYGK
ncbi:PREDICTED: UDP-glycosyltransferase 74E2-like [Ipomoea nil]|uniref:UDP-glycosyltransferase 74E2-like n=1 Tax=Ipomoea nil TaxID=35883 RepID=UPI0009015651|nr:PREDICTED: UDP-glycosyltransferase 74E2-like [Ipomoea nil]